MLIEKAFEKENRKRRCILAVVYLPNLDVGEGHETLDIN